MEHGLNTPAQVDSSAWFSNAGHRSDVQHRTNYYRLLSFCSVRLDADHSGEKLVHLRRGWKHSRLVFNSNRLFVEQ